MLPQEAVALPCSFRSAEIKGEGHTMPTIRCGARVVSAVTVGLNSLKRLGIEFLTVGFADSDRRMGTAGSTDSP